MKTTTGWILACALGIAVMGFSAANAQSTLGGAKLQQNKIGGVAKPQPVVGGATVHPGTSPTLPKPGPVIGMTKPGALTLGATTPPGPTAGNTRPNPPINPQSRGGALATASKGPKP